MRQMVVLGRCAPEQNVLLPFSTHSSPSSAALVLAAAASDPEPGSLIQMENVASPFKKGGRYLCFCSGVPWLEMFVAVNIDVMMHAAVSRLYLAMASQKMANMTGSAATSPSSSGSSNPSHPWSAIFLYTS